MITSRRLLKFLRRDVLTAISILALAINFIGSFGPFIQLANFARYIVDHWVEVTSFLWIWLFGLLSVHVPPLLGFALTMLCFHVGLVASSFRWGSSGRDAVPAEELSRPRDRLLSVLLYLPIMASTLMTAFGTLAHDAVTRSDAPNSFAIVLSFIIVVASPVVVFRLGRPQMLIRRFLTIYVVATVILLLNFASRLLDTSGAANALKEG
jgi:hypothetical protein